ncbi:hypothetical protein [uncultured Sphaerochaeta sp.]|uniref:hypothetical protein n=1 Tax=uncultured Sphaerochaeta sp. TaxID=886478 RepID=UPI002A0A5AC3|nr:hypothetical protein [uncultured Sphaerochaeta sp.]
MKTKRIIHSIVLLLLTMLVVLFLSTFLVTCFTSKQVNEPSEEAPSVVTASPEIILVQTPALDSGDKQETPGVQASEIAQKIPEKGQVSVAPPNSESIDRVSTQPIAAQEVTNVTPTLLKGKIPELPQFTKVFSRASVPLAPTFFEPSVYTVDDYNKFVAPSQESAPDTQKDPFADFFVSGDDATASFENGLYYLGLFVNDEYIGDIEANFLDGIQSLNTSELAMFVGDYITKDTYDRLFSDGLSYISIDELNKRGIETAFDSTNFTVSMKFGVSEMPVKTLSVTASSVNRREAYSLSGAIKLKSAKFSVVTSLGFYSNITYATDFSSLDTRLFSLSVVHKVAFWDLGIDISYSLSSNSPYFNFGSWSGFYDFVETSQRLSFGNVGSDLSSVKTISDDVSNVGISLEKNYSYGTESALGNQFEYNIVLVEDSTVDITINNDSVYSRQLSAGTYRLKDFVFTQGVNMAKVTITPVSRPADYIVQYFDLGYDYRLMGKGDSLYGLTLSVPRTLGTAREGMLSIPWLDGKYLSYYLGNWTATYQQQTGITNSFTFSTDLSVTPGIFSGTFSGVYASLIGTTQLQMTLGLDTEDSGPSFTGSISHRFNTVSGSRLGSLSIGFSYTNPAVELNSTSSSDPYYTANFSYSGFFTKTIRYTLTGSLTKVASKAGPSWTTTLSSGFSPFKNFSVSGSVTASASNSDPLNPTITGQISGNYSFTPKLNSNVSSTFKTTSVGMSYRASQNDSFNASLNGVNFQDTSNQSLLATWSHSGEFASFTLRQQAYDSYQKMSTLFSANTNIAYADGAFALAKSVNEAFLLIKPIGEMKNSEISIARSLDSSPEYLRRPLGSAMYNNISTNSRNSVVVFGSGSSLFGAGSSFVYDIVPRSRQAFVATVDMAATYTVSGRLFKPDHTPYSQYSSPVYDVTIDSQGGEVLTPDESLYLFTDVDGRYILSDVTPGNYLFDLEVGDLWYAVRFKIPEMVKGAAGKERVLALEDFWVSDPQIQQRLVVRDIQGNQVKETQDVFGTVLATGYDASITLKIEKHMDEDSFWAEVFPTFGADQSSDGNTIVEAQPISNVAP